MQTHTTTLNHVLVTTSGQAFRPEYVIACASAKNDTGLRIVMRTGEVICDHWPTIEDRRAFQARVRYAMQGITDIRPAHAPTKRPEWATPENAAIAAADVLTCGDTREHAAQVYARTLFGEGVPAHAIDSEEFKNFFDERLAGDGPVLVLAGMDDPNHSNTLNPITVKSPLARLAILAVDMGAHPDRVIFSVPVPEREGPSLENEKVREPKLIEGCAITSGEDGLAVELSQITTPRKVFYWCSLAGRFFLDWVGFGGPAIECIGERDAYTAAFDEGNDQHIAVLYRLATHFDVQGYGDAAKRLCDELALA